MIIGHLLCVLSLLEMARRNLILDFIELDSRLSIPMFKYECDIHLQNLSIEQYFMGWVDSHFVLFSGTDNESPDVYSMFLKSMEVLMEMYISDVSTNTDGNGELWLKLLNEKQKLIVTLLDFGDKNTADYDKLLHLYERDKALFEREIKFLREDR